MTVKELESMIADQVIVIEKIEEKRGKRYKSVQDFRVDAIEAERAEKSIKKYNRKINKERLVLSGLEKELEALQDKKSAQIKMFE